MLPSKVIDVYIFEIGCWGFEPPCFICHLNVFSSDENCSRDTFTPQFLILNRFLSCNYEIRSDRTIWSKVLTVSIFLIEAGLGFGAPHFIFYTNLFPMDSNCSMEPCLRACSWIQTFCVDWKGMEQNIWAHPLFYVKMHHFWRHWWFYMKHIH